MMQTDEQLELSTKNLSFFPEPLKFPYLVTSSHYLEAAATLILFYQKSPIFEKLHFMVSGINNEIVRRYAQCLKITEKVSFNIASEASYVYVFKSSWKMPKWRFFKTRNLQSNSVTRQANFNLTKSGGKCQNWNTQLRHFGWFSNTLVTL